jgi:LysM repeat protein
MKLKMPRLPQVPKLLRRRPQKPAPQKLAARVRAADPAALDYEDEEPQTKLTSAFIVVLILHVVAVGGVMAFNQIKSNRRASEPTATAEASAKKSVAAKEDRAALASPDPVQALNSAPVVASVAVPPPSFAPVSKQRIHNVKSGDTLHAIAKAHGVSVADLKTANGLTNDAIRIGQVLNLPSAKPAAIASKSDAEFVKAEVPKAAAPAEAKPTAKMYTVKTGDRLIFIAKKFSVSQEDLIALNKIKDPAKLQVGQVLKVPVKSRN